MPIAAVILAAGQGTRMKSDLPKVLHKIQRRPMLSFVIDAVKGMKPDKIIVVIGYQADRVRAVLENEPVDLVLQEEQLGTGHAVAQCRRALAGFGGTVLILNGDVPCLQTGTLIGFVEFHSRQGASATVLTAVMEDAAGYGRIVRDADRSLLKIVEHKDADESELEIKEINSGMFCFDGPALFEALEETDRKNVQNEYYLTDVIELMNAKGLKVCAFPVDDAGQVAGVNDVAELEQIRRFFEGKR